MIYRTKLGLPSQYIASVALSKGEAFSLETVHLKETVIPATEETAEITEMEIDIWYLRSYKDDEETMPLGIACTNVEEDAELKDLILFRIPEFTRIKKT